MLQVVFLPIARHLLGAFSGSLVGSGFINENDANVLAGAALTVLTIAWSIIEKLIAKRQA